MRYPLSTIGAVFPLALLLVFAALLNLSTATAAQEYRGLVIAEGPSVYYVTESGERLGFPNAATYFTWYTNFNNIQQISVEELAGIPLVGAVRYKPGARMLKLQSNPKVYVVDKNGMLRWVATEEIAISLYGPDWATIFVDDLPDGFFSHYGLGQAITRVGQFSPSAAQYSNPTIEVNRVPAEEEEEVIVEEDYTIIEEDRTIVEEEEVPAEEAPAEVEYTYSIYSTDNVSQGVPYLTDVSQGMYLRNEVQGNIVAVERENVVVLVPEGYEDLAKAHVEDLITCQPALSNFLGVPFPQNQVKLKIFISDNDSQSGTANPEWVFYKWPQATINAALSDVQENHPDGFLSESGSEYCSNTHELTHVYTLGDNPMRGWFTEGLAEYTQKHNQPGTKEGVECLENEWAGGDPWETGDNYRLFPYSNLSEGFYNDPAPGAAAKWYITALCQVQEIDQTYGRSGLQRIVQRLRAYPENPYVCEEQPCKSREELFFDLLVEELGSGILDILSKYGL